MFMKHQHPKFTWHCARNCWFVTSTGCERNCMTDKCVLLSRTAWASSMMDSYACIKGDFKACISFAVMMQQKLRCKLNWSQVSPKYEIAVNKNAFIFLMHWRARLIRDWDEWTRFAWVSRHMLVRVTIQMQQLYEFDSCITSEIWPQPNVVSFHESVHGVFDHRHMARVSATAIISRDVLKFLLHPQKHIIFFSETPHNATLPLRARHDHDQRT